MRSSRSLKGAPAVPSTELGRDRLLRLRSATRREHEAAEAALGLADPAITRDRYHLRLEQLYGFYAPIEERLAELGGWGERGVDIEARRKAPLLRADLAALGAEPIDRIPLCSRLPPLEDAAAGFGCLYVLEGATLGGQIISRHIRSTLGIIPGRGGSFFRGYGEQTGEMWRSFGAALTAFPVDAAADGRILTTAVATFCELRRWCEGHKEQ